MSVFYIWFIHNIVGVLRTNDFLCGDYVCKSIVLQQFGTRFERRGIPIYVKVKPVKVCTIRKNIK